MVGTSKELIKRLVELPDDKKYEIKEYKEKRSLNANNYYWQLVTELGNVLGMDKEWLHFLLLQKNHGKFIRLLKTAPITMEPCLRVWECIEEKKEI